MSFTDEDLKLLKECIAGDHPHAVGECLNLDADDYAKKVEALLARLEAAEEVIAEFKLEPVPVGVVERWRKAAGK